MGQRANLLIVTGGAYELCYTHHRANTLDHDLFWGPDYALGFIRAQRRVTDADWLNDVWAEGGAVMDLDRRVLLWFGGEGVLYEVPLRRAHTRLMAASWPPCGRGGTCGGPRAASSTWPTTSAIRGPACCRTRPSRVPTRRRRLEQHDRNRSIRHRCGPRWRTVGRL